MAATNRGYDLPAGGGVGDPAARPAAGAHFEVISRCHRSVHSDVNFAIFSQSG